VLSCRFGGRDGVELQLEDRDDLVVVRTKRRGARHDVSPLRIKSRAALDRLTPLFGFPPAGVGIWAAPEGSAPDLAAILHDDPEIEFAGRGLRDQHGAPVVYTENVFVKFAESVPHSACAEALSEVGLELKRPVPYAGNAYFAEAPDGIGRSVFETAEKLLGRGDVDLCHPELVREIGWNGASPEQWHLQPAVIAGVPVDAHANVVAAWEHSTGRDVTIAVIDDGVDIEHRELAGDGRIVAPFCFSGLRSDNPRPAEGDNHGTACAGIACAAGAHGASGVAPDARLMPLRLVSGIGSQDEADALAWAADHGADVISCSWGPPDGNWRDALDPQHQQLGWMPDSTRLALEHATTAGRDGRGCVITWAAGNGDESVDLDQYASSDRVVAVAACNDVGERAPYSDKGAAVWCCFPSGNVVPSLTPGIWTTDRSGAEGYNSGSPTLGDAQGDFYNSFDGTSASCPGVAGVAALVLTLAPELRWQEVKDLLRQACDRIGETPGEYDGQGHSAHFGFGRVNALSAVQLARR
jgi:subtilisin family serine protease